MTLLEPTLPDTQPAAPIRPIGAWLLGLVVIGTVAALWALVATLFLLRA